MEFGPKAPICKNPLNATICDPKLRTVNTGAECGGPDDYFFYSPWRRPGSAPVIDACGTAGGRIPGQGAGGFGAQYQNTTHARIGDLGSRLPHTPSGVTWKAGIAYEVAWTLQAYVINPMVTMPPARPPAVYKTYSCGPNVAIMAAAIHTDCVLSMKS